jgi:hypothetical protein
MPGWWQLFPGRGYAQVIPASVKHEVNKLVDRMNTKL